MRRPFSVGESSGVAVSDSAPAIEAGIEALRRHRHELEAYVRSNPAFLHSFTPIRVPASAPEVAIRMASAIERAGVGPMAAVAGALADLSVEAMTAAGARVAVLEDGGEAALASDRPVDIALQAGSTELSRRFGFRVEQFPCGVATSSGVYSHAFSFGDAEAVTVFASDAATADAAATASCNLVTGPDTEAAIRKGIAKALSVEGVTGVFVLYRGTTGTGGRLPRIIGVSPGGTA